MKHFLFSILFLFLCFNTAEAQTNANIPGPENVLVVYNSNSEVSDSVMQYYVSARNIPSSNICPLEDLISHNITIDAVTHRVIIAQETDIIRDSINHQIGTWYATEHAWKYFYQYVAAPIKNWITSNNLTSIRYIVLCKGVPFKIQAAADSGGVICNTTVDGLLCLLNTNNYEDFLHDLYTVKRSYAISGNNYCYYCTMQITNPYFSGTYGIDPDYTFNYRFAPGYFTRSWNSYTVKLDYLVSHLDGISYNVVKGIIDRSVEPDMSGNAFWILDHDPGLDSYQYLFSDTKNRLESFDFNFEYDATNNWITSHSENVMGYSSWGTHAENGNCDFNDSAWVKDSLKFNLSNGAIFNSYESFNGTSLSTLVWRWIDPHYPNYNSCNHTQGLATQWTEIGGTGFTAHAWEPFINPFGVLDNRKTFNTYAMGYSMVDAFYQGIKYLSWVNFVVGDPLTTIAWGKQSLTSNLNWSGTNLVTGEIEIPAGKTLTIADSSTINLRHQGFITGEGELVIGQSVTFNIYSWQKGLFLSYDSDSPRLVWGMHPTLGTGANYKVYRKIGSLGNWDQIATTTNLQYTDTEMLIGDIGDLMPNLFYKVVAFSELPGTYESNTVSCVGNKNPKKEMANQNNVVLTEYSLEQNYPNPFNPSTQIKYSIKEAGLVQLRVYDILGKEVANLVNENKDAGYYSVDFSVTGGASELSSGVYIYQLQSNSFISSKKMIVIK